MASIFSRAKQQGRLAQLRRGLPLTRRVSCMLTLACLCAGLGACENAGKSIYDYINFRNSFLDPSQVGRFDKDNPWGNVRPVKWPILDQLDVIDQPADQWSMATDPTPADLVVDKKEVTIQPGDMVHLSIFGLLTPDQEWTRDVAVSQAGSVNIPYMGVVPISGMTANQAQDKIAEVAIAKSVLAAPGPNTPGPQISVSLIQSAGRVFSVLGAVARPGTYSIYTPDLRVMMAISQVGDLSGGGTPGMDYLYIIRSSGEP